MPTFQITTEQSIWFFPLCLLLGFGYAFWLYRKDDRFEDTKKWIKQVLFFCRFSLVSILAFLLLSPFIKIISNTIEKPIVIFAQDNSSSILMNKDSSFYKDEYLKQTEEFIGELSKDFEVKKYTFGETLNNNQPIDYSEKSTNLSEVFNQIESKYYNQNVGALILASDGIYNQGSNPLFLNSSPPYNIYTILLGDTTIRRDLILKEVIHNKITFLKNKFPVEIFAQINKAAGKKTTLKIIQNESVLYTKDFFIQNHTFSISETVILEAKNTGTQHYRIEFSELDDETSIINNKKDIYIEVLDGRQNILILANSPHPDIAAIKKSIESNENYKVTTDYYSSFNGNLTPYSLLIAHQIPTNQPLFKVLQTNPIPVWYIIGTQSSEIEINRLNLGVELQNSKGQFNDILPKSNSQFPLFTLSENTQKLIEKFAPLKGYFGNYKPTFEIYPLLNQKIGNIETKNPLLYYAQLDSKKLAVLFGEGIWKWRMQDFLTNQNHNAINELINKTVQFLSLKEDKSKFRISHNSLFKENEEIIINAELYNDSYELINDPEVKITLTGENQKNYNFIFNKTSKAYFLNAGVLPTGSYSYSAHTTLGDKKYVQNGKFQVIPLVLEANSTTANAQLLQNIASKYGGKMVYPNLMKSLADEIRSNKNITSIIFEELKIKEWIHLRWLFFVLLTLLSLEWFMRKQNGAY